MGANSLSSFNPNTYNLGQGTTSQIAPASPQQSSSFDPQMLAQLLGGGSTTGQGATKPSAADPYASLFPTSGTASQGTGFQPQQSDYFSNPVTASASQTQTSWPTQPSASNSLQSPSSTAASYPNYATPGSQLNVSA